MKGHIRERSPGHWAIVIDTRDPTTGKRKRKWHSFRGNKRAAQLEAARLITEAKRGTSIDPSKATLREYFPRWLDHMTTQVSPRTIEIYTENVEYLILPALGNEVLGTLKPEQIAKAYATALQSGRRKGRGGLSPRTVGMMHRTLSQGLKQAVVWKLLPNNPADFCKPPRVERKEMKVHTVDTTVGFLDFAKGNRLYVPILLHVMCGIRRAEIAAVRWNRLDLDNATLSVSTSIEQTKRGLREKPPKNGRGRLVALPAIVVDELRRHRLQQAEDLLRLGIRQTDDTHVCLLEDGSPWPPRLITHAFMKLIRRSGFPRIRLHDLRHSHATHLLVKGVHPKVVQERLGHASIQLTLDTYSHIMPSMQDDAAATIDVAFRKAMKS